MSGIEAVARKLIAELHIFNENKRYEVKQNTQAVSTLSSMKPAEHGYWVTELPEAPSGIGLELDVARSPGA